MTSAQYPDRPADLDYYWHVMNRLGTEAAKPADTPKILTRILHRT
jgi:hypothetical protein